MLFKAPWMLLLLLILPVLGRVLTAAQKRRMDDTEKLRGKRDFPADQFKRQLAFRLGAFAALIAALAQPVWNPHPGPAGLQGRDLAIALDISRSMLAADVFPTRLDAAKIALFEGLDHLRGQPVGLITFAGAASVRVPLTLDHSFVRYMLDRASPSDAEVGSTSLQSAIEKAIDVVFRESRQGQQDLIILTDGEDHLSDIEKTAEQLRDCGARVLIIGLGDPVAGARIPDSENPTGWMQYNGRDVVTRLSETTLTRLAKESPNILYVPAQTRPFDLLAIYRKMLADTQSLPAGDSGQIVYTEGYPLLIALALLLWFFPLLGRLRPLLAALLLAGCAPDSQPPDHEFSRHFDHGRALWAEVQPGLRTDPRAAIPLLIDAREAFLQAALISPGNVQAAQQIAGVSTQLAETEQLVREQQKAEEELQRKLQAAIQELQELIARETALSEKSRQLLKKQPPASQDELLAAAVPALKEQTGILDRTDSVTETVQSIQEIIREAIAALYGKKSSPPPTEFDAAIDKLNDAKTEQQNATIFLQADDLRWPQANSAFFSAARRMQEALVLLPGQNQNGDEDQESQPNDDLDQEMNPDAEWDDSTSDKSLSMPMNSLDFFTALENQSLPVPNYTAEEIMQEEAANLEQRAQQKASRAGAAVEKNW